MPEAIVKKETWKMFEFYVPIKEYPTNNADEFMIKGTAISETVTHNNHKYVAEELQKAVSSLNGRPLLVDHDNRIESIKGVVSNAVWNEYSKSIDFEAKVMDKNIREMIKDGRVNKVSVGAFAEDLVHEEETDAYVAKGIRFAELSLVAVPADENATFAMAMDKSFKIKESMELKSTNNHINERRYSEMTEENAQSVTESADYKKLQEEVLALRSEKRNNLIGHYKKLCTEKSMKEKDVSKLSEDTINALIETLSEIKEIKVAEKPEMKSVAFAEKQDADDFIMERSASGFSLWKMPDSKGRITFK